MKNYRVEDYVGKKFLITGGLGFVGVNLISVLLSAGIKPSIIDYVDQVTANDSIYVPFCLEKLDFHNIDINCREQVLNTVKQINPDTIIHLASMTDLTKNFTSAIHSVDTNIKGTIYLLEAIHDLDITNFVFLSSSDVYGNVQPPFREDQVVIPASPYSVSKISAELYCLMFNRVYNLPITILRSFNLFGKYQSPKRIIPYIITELIQENDVKLTAGEQKREFNFIDNLLDAIFLSLMTPQSQGNIINIGNGKSVSIRDIALDIGHKLDSTDRIKFGAKEYRPNEIWDMYCDNSKAEKILGWEPQVSLEEGLNQTIKWFQDVTTQ